MRIGINPFEWQIPVNVNIKTIYADLGKVLSCAVKGLLTRLFKSKQMPYLDRRDRDLNFKPYAFMSVVLKHPA